MQEFESWRHFLSGQEAAQLSMDEVHLIGYSLGAHVAGFAGSHFRGRRKVGRITGMKKANTCFKLDLSESAGVYIQWVSVEKDAVPSSDHVNQLICCHESVEWASEDLNMIQSETFCSELLSCVERDPRSLTSDEKLNESLVCNHTCCCSSS